MVDFVPCLIHEMCLILLRMDLCVGRERGWIYGLNC